MASTASPSVSLLGASRGGHGCPPPPGGGGGRGHLIRVLAASDDTPKGAAAPPRRRKGTPGVDTRIHWSDPDEGWLGGGKPRTDAPAGREESSGGGRYADLIATSTTSHYQLSSSSFLSLFLPLFSRHGPREPLTAAARFLGVAADADAEEIKAAYRKLSKEYHPDTTALPLKTASQRFVQLREAYKVLSDGEKRRFYDWTLAREEESRLAERMRMRPEDPYAQDVRNWESIPDTVDRLGGRNMELSDQAMTALTIDVVIIIFALCCVAYVVLFKEPY